MGDLAEGKVDLYDAKGALTADELERLLASRDLSRVRELHAYLHYMDDGCMSVLSKAPFLRALQRLRLSANAACNSVTPAAFVTFFDRIGAGLGELEVSGLAVGDAGAAAIAGHPTANQLVTLVLDGAALSGRGLAMLLPVLRSVEWLDLSNNRALAADGVRMLAAWPALVGCRGLELGGMRVGDEGAIAIAAAGPVARLERLGLRSNELGNAGAAAVAKLQAPRLRHLDLSHNRIETTALQAVIDAWPAAEITTQGNASFDPELAAELDQHLIDGRLRLEDQSLERSPERHTLLHWQRLAEVRHLELVSSPIALADLAALLAKPALGSLETLVLSDTIAGRSGNALIELLTSADLRSLRRLSLEHLFPRVDREGMASILALPFLGRLDSLGLAGSLEGSPSLDEAERPSSAFRTLCAHDGPFVKRLGLRYVVGDQEIKAIVKAPWFPSLAHLDISSGNLSAYGLYVLLRALADSRIETVDLSENCPGDSVNSEVEAKKVWDDMRPATSHVRIREPSW
jgi:hypothetical protein